MRKPLLLAPVLLLASCRSEQVAFQSLPAISEPVTAPTAMSLDPALAATVVAGRPTSVTLTNIATSPSATNRLVRAAQRPQRAGILRPLATLATATSTAPAAKQLVHQWRRPRPTDGAAENGLGGIALFFIGVVLAVLAGLAALVSLIPGVSFWGGLGLAAAGLVVLFLLYSLLSGGKGKKKKQPGR